MVMFFLVASGLLLVLLVLGCCCGLLSLSVHKLSAHGGKWHCSSADLMCCSSLLRFSCVEETTLALCVKVLKTLCFAVMWWLLSQCRYWSVCVGFL